MPNKTPRTNSVKIRASIYAKPMPNSEVPVMLVPATQKTLKAANVASLVLLTITAVMLAPYAPILGMLMGETEPDIWQAVQVLAAVVFTLPVHEAIHWVLLPGPNSEKHYTGKNPLAAAVYSFGLGSKTRWLCAVAAPFLVLSAIPIALLLAGVQLPQFFVAVAVFNVAVSTADYLTFWTVARTKAPASRFQLGAQP